jgi:hypothetical protein
MQSPPAFLTILYATGKYPGANSTIPPTPFKKEHVVLRVKNCFSSKRVMKMLNRCFDIGIPVWLPK